MIERARENAEAETTPAVNVVAGRFARDASEFRTMGETSR